MISASVLLALLSAFLCNMVATTKNRSRLVWTLAGFFFPVISLIIILILNDLPRDNNSNPIQ
jgi:hypothetical protein